MADLRECLAWVFRSSSISRPCQIVSRSSRMLVFAVFFLVLVTPVLAKKKKKNPDDLLEAWPHIFKFCMFWWCIFVFCVMAMFIIDSLIARWFGPARVDWTVEHTFRGGSNREDYWAQFVDIRKWSVTRHPVLQSADVRFVKCDESFTAATPNTEVYAGDGSAPDSKLTPILPAVMKPGFGFTLRHKVDSGERGGTFYCTRKCIAMEKPKTDVWQYTTQTVEVGAGYSFQAGSEITELRMWPPADDGSIRCEMSGQATVRSRVFRWWSALIPNSKEGAAAFLEAIGKEVEQAKKSD